MNKITDAMHEIHEIDELAERDTRINQLHPLIKLLVTVIYIVLVVSYDKYNLLGLITMVIYPLLLFALADVSIGCCFHKLRVVLPMIFMIGIFNPIFDRNLLYHVGSFPVSGGMVSMITLILKGTFALMASFLLITTTGIERFCYALKLLHLPSIMVTQILLLYRYLTVLMAEANAVIEAYSLRAPKEKGVKYKIWGSLLGQLLFRSLDRAENIYDSMLLRGFHGEYYYAKHQKLGKTDITYFLLWIMILALLRVLPIGQMVSIFF